MMIIDDLPNDDTMMIFDQEVRLILTTKRLVTTSCPSEKTARVNFLVSFSLLSEWKTYPSEFFTPARVKNWSTTKSYISLAAQWKQVKECVLINVLRQIYARQIKHIIRREASNCLRSKLHRGSDFWIVQVWHTHTGKSSEAAGRWCYRVAAKVKGDA